MNNSSVPSCVQCSKLIVNDVAYTDHAEIANVGNKHFTTVGDRSCGTYIRTSDLEFPVVNAMTGFTMALEDEICTAFFGLKNSNTGQ